MNQHRKAHLGLAVLMAAAEAATSTAAGAVAGAVPTSNVADVATAEKPKRAPKNPENTLNIINGRMPMPLVYLIRFKETGTVAERAKKYGTSVGKVVDITKGHNFAYVTATYKPSTDELAAAIAWCETAKTAKGQSLKEAGGDPDAIKSALGGLGVATAEEVAARNWTTRTVGAKTTTTAPVAEGSAPAAAAAAAPTGTKQAAAGSGAKLF